MTDTKVPEGGAGSKSNSMQNYNFTLFLDLYSSVFILKGEFSVFSMVHDLTVFLLQLPFLKKKPHYDLYAQGGDFRLSREH